MKRQVLKNVYYRIDIPFYVNSLNDYTEETQAKAKQATRAFFDEITAIFEADGWQHKIKAYLRENSGHCHEIQKGSQSLYFHPQSISGEVDANDIERIESLIKSAKTLTHRSTDIYDDIIVTTSFEDEKALYEETYGERIFDFMQEALTTKRRNLYKYNMEALFYCLFRKIHIFTTISGRGITTDEAGWQYILDKYQEAKGRGLIIEAANPNLCRWISKNDKTQAQTLNLF
jgi:hypothetical protein